MEGVHKRYVFALVMFFDAIWVIMIIRLFNVGVSATFRLTFSIARWGVPENFADLV